MKNRYEVRGDTTVIFLECKGRETKETFIDTDDLPLVLKLNVKWRAALQVGGKFYVRVSASKQTGYKSLALHRLLTSAPDDKVVDHYDGNTLNNRKSNLKIVTATENNINAKLRKNNKTGVKGVHWNKVHKKWAASIYLNGKQVFSKMFEKFDDAVSAVNEARRFYHPYLFESDIYDTKGG